MSVSVTHMSPHVTLLSHAFYPRRQGRDIYIWICPQSNVIRSYPDFKPSGHEGTMNSRNVEMANAARKSVKPFPGNCGPEQNRVEFDESICMLF